MMRKKNDDAAHAREDSFLTELIPQVAEHLAERHAEDFDAEAGQARFETWLAARTRKPAVPARSRANAGHSRPAGTGRTKRSQNRLSSAWDAIPVPDGRFLIWLSGARREVLEECPADRPKYTGIGVSILVSAALVGASVAFALVTALNVTLLVALPVAFASGAAALSLNRFSVVSLPRTGKARAQLFYAIPRFLLALLVGLVISTPFVLQIFQPQIQHQITVQRDQAIAAYEEQVTGPLAQQVAAAQANYNAEVAALAQARPGVQATVLRQEVAEAEQELRADQAALQQQRSDAVTAANQDNTGLLARLQALNAVTAGSSVLAAARWLLVALFAVLYCLPVMIKVMLNLGPASTYDKILEAEESTQLEIAERKREMRLAAQERAAEAMEDSLRDRLAGLNAPLPGIKDQIIAARMRVEKEWLREWEADQMRRSAVAADKEDDEAASEEDDDDSLKGSPAHRDTLSVWRGTARLAVGAAVGVTAVLAFRPGTPFAIAAAAVMGGLLVSALVVAGITLQSADRTDRLVMLVRALRSENPSIAGSQGRDRLTRPQPPAKARYSAPAGTMTSGSSKTGLSSRGREAGATAKFCRSCGSLTNRGDTFCASCGRPRDSLSSTKG
jgi:Domain of unknown function (DUF4407)